MHPSQRRCPVGSGFGPVQKRTQLGHQVRFVVRGVPPVHPSGAVAARAPVGHEQPGEVEVVVPGSESPLRGLPRKLRYLLLSRGHGIGPWNGRPVSLQQIVDQRPPSLSRLRAGVARSPGVTVL